MKIELIHHLLDALAPVAGITIVITLPVGHEVVVVLKRGGRRLDK